MMLDGDPGWSAAHALIFTGHMVDTPGRPHPRFPAWAEARARIAIRQAIAGLTWTSSGETLGIAGAASGGDLLFHEVCNDLGIHTCVLLAMPQEAYIESSVASAGPGWVRRFETLLERRAGQVYILGAQSGLSEGPTDNLWQRTNLWMIEEAIAAAPERTLLALWDGRTGDGPGGTEHMFQAARRNGVRVAPPISLQSLTRVDDSGYEI